MNMSTTSTTAGPRARRRRLRAPGKTAAAALALCSTLAAAQSADTIVGLTSNWQLASFSSASPTQGSAPVSISGLQFNEVVLGIDFRPSNGLLYGLGSFNNLYTLDARTGQASFVASLTNASGGAAFALSAGRAYDIDFNPVPDLGQTLPSLRVTSSGGDNLRINVNGASAGQVSVDTALSVPGGSTPRLAGSAYTNNDRDPATGTALYGIDFDTDRLFLQSPPNNGTLVTVGALGVDTSALVGFDVSGITGNAYASLTNPIDSRSSLYRIDLATGAALLLGAYGVLGNTSAAAPLMDIAVAPVPEPSTYALMLAGLGALGFVLRRRPATR